MDTSTRAQTESGLNAELLGIDGRLADSEVVNRSLMRLAAVFGSPWGRDEKSAQVMGSEWEMALADMPAVALDGAVTEWIRCNAKWPRPSDMRAIADRWLGAKTERASEQHGLHPVRIKPTENMKGMVFRDSNLRRDPTWTKFLNGLHPMYEDGFFANADCLRAPHFVTGMTAFGAEYVNKNWGRELTRLFGRPVRLSIGEYGNTFEMTDELWRPPTPEERERVSKAVRALLDRWRDPGSTPRERSINLEGASPEFMDLIGEGDANHA